MHYREHVELSVTVGRLNVLALSIKGLILRVTERKTEHAKYAVFNKYKYVHICYNKWACELEAAT
jgi:hypothetical protein